MAKTDNISKALGSVSAVMTLLERYPALLSVKNVGFDTSFGLMLNVLKILGLNEKDVIEWLSDLLSGDGADGLLEGLEWSVKSILLANIKDMFTCSINPLIPNDLMEEYTASGVTIGGKGFEMDLDTIDLYGTLENCPSNKEQSVFYFDSYDSDYEPDNTVHPALPPTQLWKSRDFNAFLWYVINKGTISDKNKLYWDNRVNYFNKFKGDSSLKERFFSATEPVEKSGNIVVDDEVYKKRIIKCVYSERLSSLKSNVLRIHINPERYYARRKVRLKLGNSNDRFFYLNKTIFEFNYDYIMSLKLFNSKTLVANIINAILGLSANVSLNYSIKREVIAAQIGEIVRKMIVEDDTEVTDCHFTFSNDEYDRMMAESIRKHNGTYTYNNENIEVDYLSIVDSINEISGAADLQQKIQAISNAFNDIAATVARNGEVSESDEFSFSLNIIHKLLQETVVQIVLQILSPKVFILYRINSEVMGNLENANDVSETMEDFMENMENLVVKLIREIKDMVIQQMYSWMMAQLSPLLELYTSRLMLETIRYYRELIEQLITTCGGAFGSLADMFGGNTNLMEYAIDNVNYADIVPTQKAPKKEC